MKKFFFMCNLNIPGTFPHALSFVTRKKEINSLLSVTSFQAVVESNEVFPHLLDVWNSSSLTGSS